ncbi:hsp70 family protein [Micromonospora sp. NPDC049559]|uniref:hsp70 family protein n=1 Tax=Micromonospora sp. NPDC049559 TaxID=3155923 RepID=UPI00343DB63E
MAGLDGGYGLGVDLGTSNTVAVLRRPDGRTRPLLFDGQPTMPSGVLLDGAGRLHVGRDAQRLAQADPVRYEPNPKRRVDEPLVLLGDREIPTAELLAATLRAVAAAAVEAVGFVPPAVLTHPAGWGARRREVLAEAVRRAGWPPVGSGGTGLVPEPVAAARYFAEALRRPVPLGAAIAVFDFGGGTLDVAVVRNSGVDQAGRARFEVIGSGGIAELGGLDLDAALVEQIGTVVAATDPETWQRLARPETPARWRERRQLWDEVRAAKEMLSRTSTAPVVVPGLEQALHLTRTELERLATPLLRRGVAETASVIAGCGLTPDQLAGLFLVGGSSRVPLVARLLHADLGIAPTVLEQPELPVAEGAVVEFAPAAVAEAAMPGAARVATAAPVSGVPVSPGAPGAPVSPMSSGVPVSPGAPVSGVMSPDSAAAAGPGGRPRRRTTWIVAAAVAALAGVVGAVALYLTRDRYPDLDYQPFADAGTVAFADGANPSTYLTAFGGDRVYFAYDVQERLEVVAVDTDRAATGAEPLKEAWRERTSGSAKEWLSIVALPDVLVAVSRATGRDEPCHLVAFAAGNGSERWRYDLRGCDRGGDQVFFFDDRIVVLDRARDRLVGLDAASGRQRWSEPNPKHDQYAPESFVTVVRTADDLGGPADAGGAPMGAYHGDDRRIVQFGGDHSVRVVAVSDGTVLKTRGTVADPDLTAAYGDRLYVANDDGGYHVDEYDLTTLGEPVTTYSAADDQRRLAKLTPCGEQRLCLLETVSFDPKTAELQLVDTKARRRLWSEKVPDAELVVPVGEHILVGASGTDRTATILTPEKGVLVRRDGAAVRVDGGNVLFFAEGLSTIADDRSVAGLGLGSTVPTELGQLKGSRSATCSWNSRFVACAQDSGFALRRFAKG